MEANLWDEPTVVEQLQSDFSDFYKEVHGFRPRYATPEQWNSEAWLVAELDKLEQDSVAVFAEQEAQQQRDIAAFEVRVADAIKLGAGDRATALRWLLDADDCQGDLEFLCYKNGLPYRYFANDTAQSA
jgi:hypothetical protein